MKQFFGVIMVCVAGLSAGAQPPGLDVRGWTLDQHVEHSLVVLSEAAGVTPEVFRDFFDAIKVDSDAYLKAVGKARGRLWEGDEIADTVEARDEMLQRLAEGGYANFDEDLFKEIFHQKQLKLRKPSDLESQRTITLLSWLEDLVREGLYLAGKARGERVQTQWYLPASGTFWQDHKTIRDFPFEDGDVMITMFPAALSTFIGMSTTPQRRHSHAALMRKRDGRTRVVESRPPAGVSANRLSQLEQRPISSYTILRLRSDIEKRETIATRASDLAYEAIGRPYDVNMTGDPEKGFYCSQLVAWSYATAASEVLGRQVKIDELLPQVARVMSPALRDYMKRTGVEVETFVSPGDLNASRHVEVVGDYRRTDSLTEFWSQLLLSHVFVERLNAGWRAQSGAMRPLFSLIKWWERNIRDINAMPDGMTARSLVTLYDFEMNIYRPVLKAAVAQLQSSGRPMQLRAMAPWEIRGAISYQMDRSERVRRTLTPPYDSE